MHTEILIFAILTPIIFAWLVRNLSIFGGFNRSQKRAETDPNILGVYHGWFAKGLVKNPLYVSRDKVWYESRKGVTFEVPVADIERLYYSDRAIKIATNTGKTFLVEYIASQN